MGRASRDHIALLIIIKYSISDLFYKNTKFSVRYNANSQNFRITDHCNSYSREQENVAIGFRLVAYY